MPLVTVSNLLSIKKISTTQKYARVIEKKISVDIQKLKKTLKAKNVQGEKPKESDTMGPLKIV